MKSIKEISEEIGMSAYTIRFYEKEGLVSIPRNKNGIRDFDEASIDTLKAINHYRRVGMSLDDIRTVMASFNDHVLSTKLLEKTKKELDLQILELQETQHYLNEKIEIHGKLAELQKQGYNEQERLEAYYKMRRGQQ